MLHHPPQRLFVVCSLSIAWPRSMLAFRGLLMSLAAGSGAWATFPFSAACMRKAVDTEQQARSVLAYALLGPLLVIMVAMLLWLTRWAVGRRRANSGGCDNSNNDGPQSEHPGVGGRGLKYLTTQAKEEGSPDGSPSSGLPPALPSGAPVRSMAPTTPRPMAEATEPSAGPVAEATEPYYDPSSESEEERGSVQPVVPAQRVASVTEGQPPVRAAVAVRALALAGTTPRGPGSAPQGHTSPLEGMTPRNSGPMRSVPLAGRPGSARPSTPTAAGNDSEGPPMATPSAINMPFSPSFALYDNAGGNEDRGSQNEYIVPPVELAMLGAHGSKRSSRSPSLSGRAGEPGSKRTSATGLRTSQNGSRLSGNGRNSFLGMMRQGSGQNTVAPVLMVVGPGPQSQHQPSPTYARSAHSEQELQEQACYTPRPTSSRAPSRVTSRPPSAATPGLASRQSSRSVSPNPMALALHQQQQPLYADRPPVQVSHVSFSMTFPEIETPSAFAGRHSTIREGESEVDSEEDSDGRDSAGGARMSVSLGRQLLLVALVGAFLFATTWAQACLQVRRASFKLLPCAHSEAARDLRGLGAGEGSLLVCCCLGAPRVPCLPTDHVRGQCMRSAEIRTAATFAAGLCVPQAGLGGQGRCLWAGPPAAGHRSQGVLGVQHAAGVQCRHTQSGVHSGRRLGAAGPLPG